MDFTYCRKILSGSYEPLTIEWECEVDAFMDSISSIRSSTPPTNSQQTQKTRESESKPRGEKASEQNNREAQVEQPRRDDSSANQTGRRTLAVA
jgi:hypothetical protein